MSDVVHVLASGELVTVYRAMGLPPSEGAFHATTAEPGPRLTANPVGAPGTPAGSTGAEAAEDGPIPTALVAVTLNV
jgi:hypothetical protein